MSDQTQDSKAPAFQFYPKDFLTDENVQMMSLQERGAYITLLCLCWIKGSLPDQQDRMAKMCGIPLPAFRKVWPALSVCFRPGGPDRLVHPRLERERDKQREYRRRQSDKGKASGVARNRKATEHEPDMNHGSTGVQPDSVPQPNRTRTLQSSSASAISNLQKERVHAPAVPLELGKRSKSFVEWYEDKHQELIGGYIGNAVSDDAASLNLCRKFNDQELRDAALVWFGMDNHFATTGNRTIPKFASRVTECVQKARRVSA